MYSISFFSEPTLSSIEIVSESDSSASVRITPSHTVPLSQFARYLRLRYNPSQFKEHMQRLEGYIAEVETDAFFKHVFLALRSAYSSATAYSYTDAFAIESPEWRSIVFGAIRVSDMIAELGHCRIAVAGRPVRHKQFSPEGEFMGYREYDVVFETHQVDGTRLGVTMPLYAVRCWCTTTESEHWIWIESQYAQDPLEAIASTFRIHENVIPYIKELKRQGDILLVELVEPVTPRGAQRALTSKEYFSLLTAQS